MRLLTVLLLVAGGCTLVYFSLANQRLATEIDRLEAELGRMPIADATRIHIVEIEKPEVPPEVATHLARVWQFRCYLPPGYNFMRMSGSGRVTADGLYLGGGYGSSWNAPQPTPIHTLLTVSLQEKEDRLQMFLSLSGSSGTTSWNELKSNGLDKLVVQKLASKQHGPRSFASDTILPLLKIYDSTTAKVTQVAGKSETTYAGGQVVLCPKSREPFLEPLCRGETPLNFQPDWLATAVADE